MGDSLTAAGALLEAPPISILGRHASHSSRFFSASCGEASLNRWLAPTSRPGAEGVEKETPPATMLARVSVPRSTLPIFHELKSKSLAEAFTPLVFQNWVLSRISLR